MLACTDCSNFFESNLVKPDKDGDLVCPVKDCDGYLVDLDDLLADLLTRFWSLGHWTRYSCAGHLWRAEFEPHIAFSLDEENLKLKEIIEGMNDGTVRIETSEEEGEESGEEPKLVVLAAAAASSDPIERLQIQHDFLEFMYEVLLRLEEEADNEEA
ncbi:MAG TPA: hypothetical protein PLM79_02125 [Syntrophobacteraceae bacterium]|nr:hypothetical protein [Syntrophobacteraceae bacterium]